MFASKRLLRVLFALGITSLFILVLWLLILSNPLQSIPNAAALQEKVTPKINNQTRTARSALLLSTVTPILTPITPTYPPTDIPTVTPTYVSTDTQTSVPTFSPTSTPTGVLTFTETVESQLVEDGNKNGQIDPGDTVRYSIQYQNPGLLDLTNVMIVDDYDETAIATINNVTAGGVNDLKTITWLIGNLAAGDTGTITYEATLNKAFTPTGPLEVRNQVTIASDQTGAATSSTAIIVKVPNLIVSKSPILSDMNGNGQPDPGETVTYVITVTNSADLAATGILIQDSYDQTFLGQPFSISEQGKSIGNTITWQFDSLEAQKPLSVSYAAVVASSVPVGKTTVKNTVTVLSNGTLPITAENSINIEVLPSPVPTQVNSASQSAGPTSQAITPLSQAWLAFAFLIVAVAGFLGFSILTLSGKTISATLRDGYILSLIMGTVIILGLAGSVERSAIAGLIGTVAGYVLRGAVEGGKTGAKAKEGTQ